MKPLIKKVPRLGLWPACAAALILITGALTACTEALTPVEEPVIDNPIDPQNPDYDPPTVTITGGPSDGSTVSNDQVTFTWQGNKTNLRFRFRITGGEWDGTWQSWSTQTSYTLDYLDELSYTFEVQSGDANDPDDPVQVSDTTDSRTFTVDAVQGPALRMSPTRTYSSTNSTISLDIVAEDITDLTMTRVRIQFNSSLLQFEGSYSFGSFLTSNGGDVLNFDPYVDNVSGIVEFNFGVAGASPPGVSGTGTILIVDFRATGTGTTDVTFSPTYTLLRNDDNNPITIASSDLYGSRVIIQ